jgi:rod shape-determining protein MreC
VVCLLFLFYLSNSKRPRDHNTLDKVVLSVAAPIQWLVMKAFYTSSEIWSGYVDLLHVERDNRKLQLKIARLSQENIKCIETASENNRLALLLDMKDRAPAIEPIQAHVIAISPSPLFRSLRISRGSRDGIHRGAAVVTHKGVVGRTIGVSEDYTDIMLLVDSNDSTDALVQRTRARTRVRGLGGDRSVLLDLEFLPRTADVVPGDILITSGLGQVFPKGLRIGTVTSVQQGAFGLYQKATATPTVDFSTLEEVLVIRENWNRRSSFEKKSASPSRQITAEPQRSENKIRTSSEPGFGRADAESHR